MREFKTAFRRGVPMTKKSILFWLGILALLVAIAGIIYAPFYIASLQDVWYKYFAWFVFLCLILIFIIPISLTPYFGMREIKVEVENDLNKKLNIMSDNYKRDTTKLSLIKEQHNNPTRYVKARYSHLYLRNNRQIDIGIEWFNGTVFELGFLSATGIVKINVFECKISSIEKRPCSSGEFCNYEVTLPLDNDILQVIQDSIAQNKPVKLYAVINADVKVTYEYDGKSESTGQFTAQALIDNLNVFPQKM